MSKSAKKQTVISSATSGPVARPAGQTAAESESKKADPGSKQSRVIAMLRSPTGATIAAMMKATGWQQLSFPKISSGPDSRREAESSHHSGRCFRGGQTVSRLVRSQRLSFEIVSPGINATAVRDMLPAAQNFVRSRLLT